MDIVHPVAKEYLLSHCRPGDKVLTELEAETRAKCPPMRTTHYESELLAMLGRLVKARRVVSVGVFTGYSVLGLVRAMPPDGTVLACEVDTRWTEIAERYWKRAGVADRIDLRIGPALDTLRVLPAEPSFDLAHIGADKENHHLYYEELLTRLRPGGVIVIGDALRGGHVLDETCHDKDVIAVRELNEAIVGDQRVDAVLVADGDGAMIVTKR